MMVDSMSDDLGWDKKEKASTALLCMLGVGPGEMIGSIIIGRITDKFAHQTTVIINLIVVAIAFAIPIIYCSLYTFSYPLAIIMTLMLGIEDAGVHCMLVSLLGFQFESKTTPFAVFNFLKSLLIFFFIYLCSFTDSRNGYLIFYCCSGSFAIFSWLFLWKCFKVLPKE